MTDTILIEKNQVRLQDFEEIGNLFVIHFLPPDRFSIMNRVSNSHDYCFPVNNHVIESASLANFFREIATSNWILCVHINDFYLPMNTRPVENEQLWIKLQT